MWHLIKNNTKKLQKKQVVFGVALTTIAFLIMQPISSVLWERISILRAFQFPWRYLNITIFSLAFLGAAVLVNKTSSKGYIVLLLLISIVSTVVYWRPPLGFDGVNEKALWNYPLNTTYFGETDIIWSAGMHGKYPAAAFQIIEGKGEIRTPIKHDTKHTFTVVADTAVRVVDNTNFFPGWRVFANGKKLPIEFQDQNWRDLITFRLPAGTYDIQIVFGDSPVRQIAKYISLATIVVLLGGWLYKLLRLKHI
jgi:hypothetical protein